MAVYRRRSYRRRSPRRSYRRRRSYRSESFALPKPKDYNEGFKMDNGNGKKPMALTPTFKKGFKEGFKEGVEHFRRKMNYDEDDY